MSMGSSSSGRGACRSQTAQTCQPNISKGQSRLSRRGYRARKPSVNACIAGLLVASSCLVHQGEVKASPSFYTPCTGGSHHAVCLNGNHNAQIRAASVIWGVTSGGCWHYGRAGGWWLRQSGVCPVGLAQRWGIASQPPPDIVPEMCAGNANTSIPLHFWMPTFHMGWMHAGEYVRVNNVFKCRMQSQQLSASLESSSCRRCLRSFWLMWRPVWPMAPCRL